jgi:ABC-type dipeptide/oligopeptide/nickel transport system permease subunit
MMGGSTILTVAMIAMMIAMMGGMVAGTVWAIVRRRRRPPDGSK